MEYFVVAVRWLSLGDDGLAGKHRALVEHVAPAMRAVEDAGEVALWMHSFWDASGRFDAPTLRVIVATDGDAAAAAAAVADSLEAHGVSADEFDLDTSFAAERLHRFWGEHLDQWAVAKAALSDLAVAAIADDLGESFAFHRTVNRPGHVWANMLGCTYLDEAALYVALARGYLQLLNHGDGPDAGPVADALASLDAAAADLPDPMRELDTTELGSANASGTRTPRR
ncbi:hypothetical protein [Halorarum halobium]|uniref:hypothetical protein n=1 Tax=Halorarum halobium TaxID=3075121 RepID=UPI0028A8DDB2|nr:hypothetical protein [Halobaculum sp. XH14]